MMLGAMALTMKKAKNKWGIEENKKEALLKICVCEYVLLYTCVYSMHIYIQYAYMHIYIQYIYIYTYTVYIFQLQSIYLGWT